MGGQKSFRYSEGGSKTFWHTEIEIFQSPHQSIYERSLIEINIIDKTKATRATGIEAISFFCCVHCHVNYFAVSAALSIILRVHLSDITHQITCKLRFCSPSRNSAIERQRGNFSNKALICHLMRYSDVTLTASIEYGIAKIWVILSLPFSMCRYRNLKVWVYTPQVLSVSETYLSLGTWSWLIWDLPEFGYLVLPHLRPTWVWALGVASFETYLSLGTWC